MEKESPPPRADTAAMGARIRDARRALRIRTGELVSRWGLTPAMISFTERGLNGPSYRFLYALEQYGVSASWPIVEPQRTRKVTVTLEDLRPHDPNQDPEPENDDSPLYLFRPPLPIEAPSVILARLDALLVRRYFRPERLGVGCVRC